VGIAEGKAIEAATGVAPVFVVNMPAGGFLGGGGVVDTAAKAGVMARMAAWLSGLVPASTIGAAGVTGLGLAAGATAGAVLTTGTALNAGVDVMRGGSGNNWINDAFMRNLHAINRDVIQPIINLSVKIDKEGRVIADSGIIGAELNIALNRGGFGM